MVFIKNIIVNVLVFILSIAMPGYNREAKEAIASINDTTFKSSQTTLVYDDSENLISKLKEDKDSYYVGIESINDYVKYAFIATEDKNFLNHNGIDPTGIARAFVGLVKNGSISGGGSTITQQLARNIFLSHDVSMKRKVKEILIAKKLEDVFTKEEILEYYINSIYFANGAYGVDAAARKYFAKGINDLSLAEVAFVCAIPNNPTLYNPWTNYENTIKRQQRILGYMLEDGYISQKEYDNALTESINLKSESISDSDYVTTYVIDDATEKLMELNGFIFRTSFSSERDKQYYKNAYEESKTEAQNQLYNNGYRIYTSINMDMQENLQNAIDNELSVFTGGSSDGTYEVQGSAVCVNNDTGRVVAIVGGRSQENQAYSLNRAFQSYRQPGSTIKPLIVYTPAIDSKGYLPNTLVDDVYSESGPKNYNEVYDGLITLRYAVQQSKNTVAWNLFNEVGVSNGLSCLKTMNFHNIVEDDYNLSAALGGLTYGTNVLEMASAYATIANDGMYIRPTCIDKITDADGKVLYENPNSSIRVYSERASRVMTDILESTMRYGTGSKQQLDNMPSAGKTGSTNDNKDGWFVGYSPYYTCSVWVGADIPKTIEGLAGSTYPGNIWRKFMNLIHKDLEYKEFAKYENLAEEEKLIQDEQNQKLLAYEIENSLNEYLSLSVESASDIEYSDMMYSILSEKVQYLVDSEYREQCLNAIAERQYYIDSIRYWY